LKSDLTTHSAEMPTVPTYSEQQVAERERIARLDEARWWRRLGSMGVCKFAIEGDWRVAVLESSQEGGRK
jgi:hypothetical protein